jgi:hypothetical protein
MQRHRIARIADLVGAVDVASPAKAHA